MREINVSDTYLLDFGFVKFFILYDLKFVYKNLLVF